jgi:hypothetical protein
VTLLTDIREYPWTSLLAGLLPARLASMLPARYRARPWEIVPSV